MLTYLFAAATVVWVGMFVCVLIFMARQRKLHAEIAELRILLKEWSPDSQ